MRLLLIPKFYKLLSSLFVMKKIRVFVFLFLILVVQIVYAEDVFEGFGDKIDSVQDTKENVEDRIDGIKETGGSSIFEDLKNYFENTEFFSRLSEGYDKIFPVVNPISENVLLVTPSLSGVFILSLVLFILFVVYIYKILHLSFFSEGISFGISLLLTIAISVLGLIKGSAEAIVSFVGLFGIWWMQLIVGLAVLAGIVLAYIYSDVVEKFFKERKERRGKIKKDLDEIETAAAKEDIKSFAEAIRKGVSRSSS